MPHDICQRKKCCRGPPGPTGPRGASANWQIASGGPSATSTGPFTYGPVTVGNDDLVLLRSDGGVEVSGSLGSVIISLDPNNIFSGTGAPTGTSIPSDRTRTNFYNDIETGEFWYWNITSMSWIRTANTGTTGFTGPTGPNGFPNIFLGPTGPQGPEGSTGLTGDQGAMGPTGYNGYDGATGPVGTPGTAANTGATGYDGYQGEMGLTGPLGTTAITGAQGPDGVGDTGPTGPQGFSVGFGPTGITGPMGGCPVTTIPSFSVEATGVGFFIQTQDISDGDVMILKTTPDITDATTFSLTGASGGGFSSVQVLRDGKYMVDFRVFIETTMTTATEVQFEVLVNGTPTATITREAVDSSVVAVGQTVEVSGGMFDLNAYDIVSIRYVDPIGIGSVTIYNDFAKLRLVKIESCRGDTGAAGPTGGFGGPTGPLGPTGIFGDTGPQGIVGPQGPVGPMGAQGPQQVLPFIVDSGTFTMRISSFNGPDGMSVGDSNIVNVPNLGSFFRFYYTRVGDNVCMACFARCTGWATSSDVGSRLIFDMSSASENFLKVGFKRFAGTVTGSPIELRSGPRCYPQIAQGWMGLSSSLVAGDIDVYIGVRRYRGGKATDTEKYRGEWYLSMYGEGTLKQYAGQSIFDAC